MKRKLELTPANTAGIFKMLEKATDPQLTNKAGIGTYRGLSTQESKSFLSAFFVALGLPAPADDLTYDISIIIYPNNLISFGRVADVSFLFYSSIFVSLGRVHIVSESPTTGQHTDTVELVVQNRRVFLHILDQIATVPLVRKMVRGAFKNGSEKSEFILSGSIFYKDRNKFPRRAKLFQHRKKCGEYRVQVNILAKLQEQEWSHHIAGNPSELDEATCRRVADSASMQLGEVLLYRRVKACQVIKTTETQLDLRMQYLARDQDICYIYISFKDFNTEMMKSLRGCGVFADVIERSNDEKAGLH